MVFPDRGFRPPTSEIVTPSGFRKIITHLGVGNSILNCLGSNHTVAMLSRGYTYLSAANYYEPLRFCNGYRCFITGCARRSTIVSRNRGLRLTPSTNGDALFPLR